ncbi:MAG: CRISPR-associated endonuclease Cas1 [Candidatus Sericytochromatia bacterium]
MLIVIVYDIEKNSKRTKISKILECIEKAKNCNNLDELRGFEGYSSSIYFKILKNEFEDWGFFKRVKRPLTDPINTLLSFGYTILYSFISSIITLNNLSPYIGFFHTFSSGHSALASDIMEEFRAMAVDKVVFYAINNNLFSKDDFVIEEEKACYLSYEAKKKFIELLEENFDKKYFHNATGFNVNIKRLIDLQVKQYLKLLNEENFEYKGMIF